MFILLLLSSVCFSFAQYPDRQNVFQPNIFLGNIEPNGNFFSSIGEYLSKGLGVMYNSQELMNSNDETGNFVGSSSVSFVSNEVKGE